MPTFGAGRALVESQRCAQCHETKEIQPSENLPFAGSTAGCLGEPDRQRHRRVTVFFFGYQISSDCLSMLGRCA